MVIKKVLLGTVGLLMLSAVCTFGTYPDMTAYAEGGIEINETNFPDPVFRQYILEEIDDGDGELSDAEIDNTFYIGISDKGIGSLEGIKYFTSLIGLYCGDNNIETLNLSGCTSLTEVWCNNSSITELDVSGCTSLETLGCEGNNLETLDVSNFTALTGLWCDGNNLKTLNASGCTSLTKLYSHGNNLETLNVSGCTSLTELSCHENNLETLDVSNLTSLTTLWCYDNNLETLNVSGCTSLINLYCHFNNISELDVSSLTSLNVLWCNNNNIEILDVSNNALLEELICDADVIIIRYSNVITDEETMITLEDVDGNTIDPDVELEVEEVATADIVIIGENVVAAYDIILTKDGVEIQPDGRIRVTIPVPDGLNGASAKIYHKEGNVYTLVNTVYNAEDNTLSFITTHFSVYVITESEELEEGDESGNIAPSDPTEPSEPSTTPSDPVGSDTGSYHPAPGIAPAGYNPSSGSTATQKFNVSAENKVTGKSGTVTAEKSGSKVTVNLGSGNDGYYANIYNNDDEYLCSIIIENGKAVFSNEIDKSFKVVIDKIAYGDDVSSASGINAETETASASPFAGIVVLTALIGASVLVIRRRLVK